MTKRTLRGTNLKKLGLLVFVVEWHRKMVVEFLIREEKKAETN